ncbi:MAG: hypothetical protein FWF03_01495 [Defluviitaleaceae bacterium]|nr:hypothetical protein [Defluviitaleaceae bacterium]
MIEITALGNFVVSINGKNVSEYFRHTKKLLHLFGLILLNRGKPTPTETIREAVWGDGEESDAKKALQNLVYRLRALFIENGIPDVLIYQNKTYSLNESHPFSADIYRFEDACQNARHASADESSRIKYLSEACGLYGGPLIFGQIIDDRHALAAADRYKRMYIDSVCALGDIYREAKDYEKLFAVCEKAVRLEPTDESVCLRFAEGLNANGMHSQAIHLIENFQEISYRETGKTLSEALGQIYKQIDGAKQTEKHDAVFVMNELMELNTLEKAMYCGFDVFKDIFRYETRQAKRRGYVVTLILIETHGANGCELPARVLTKAKKSLNECCMLTLRRGDVFSSYSKSITAVLIIAGSEMDANVVISRIRDMFYERFKIDRVYLRFERQVSIP